MIKLFQVIEQSATWVPLARLSCHPDTRLFLCSLFAPVCLDHPIPPCRSLCVAVQSACERQMAIYGYPWPEVVKCDQFPLDNDMCIMAQHARGGVIGGDRDETRTSSATTTTTTAVISRPSNSEQSIVHKQSTDSRDKTNNKSTERHQHMHTMAEIAEETHRTIDEEQKHHHLDTMSTISQINPFILSYCRSQWSLRTKASFRKYTNDLIHGRLRSYKIIHGSGSFKGRQHAQLWADINSTVLWPHKDEQELTWNKLLHPKSGGFNSNTRFFIMGYTMQGRNKATFITEWPASADHSFR